MYGKNNIHTLRFSYDDFYTILHWIVDIYGVLRLAQVLFTLNYIEDIVTELGGTDNINIRFESSLLSIIQNMQIVGFQYISCEEADDTFGLNVKGKYNSDVESSLAHASQCLDKLSCALYDDDYVRDKFNKVKVCIVDDNHNVLASATIPISIALKKVYDKITLDEYINKMEFYIKKDV
ncbi:hypothetical protein [Sedimentibacter sp. zth1]|uniref:hypothetical protein n=1 Tax=Sedimentibacter sp. zth1 TaxID=2816908 RepID=UPI001F5FCB44|nr:hypothetical protein [Sedimentibacter sp. zth1]